MKVYIEYCQSFWFKLKRRAFQYSLNALKNPKWILMFCLTRIQVFRSWGIYISKRSWHQIGGYVNSLFPEVNVDRKESKKRVR